MWRKSDERRVRRLFRIVQQEPVPDTLREGLQADVMARFAEPGVPRIGFFSRALRPKPLLAGAVAETIEGATAAMANVEQAHLVGQTSWAPGDDSPVSERKPIPREAWYSAEHGVREDGFYGPHETVRSTHRVDKETGKIVTTEETVMVDGYTHSYIVTPDMFFTYTDTTTDQVYLPGLQPRQYEIAVEGVLRSGWAKYIVAPQPRQPGSALKDVTVTDDTLGGVSTKRIDYEACYEAYRMPDGADRSAFVIKGKIWFEADILRVLRYETLTIQGDDESLSWGQIDYDTPVDASLFEVPAGVEVIDTRLTLERRELVEQSIVALEALPEEAGILEEALVEWDEGDLAYVVVDLVENGTRLMRVKGPLIADARDPSVHPALITEWHRQTYTFDLDAERLIEWKLEQKANHKHTVPEHVKFDYSQPGAARRIDLISAGEG